MKSRKLRALALLLSAIMIITAVPSTLFAFESVDGTETGWDQEAEAPADYDLGFDYVVEEAPLATEDFDFFAADDLVGKINDPIDLKNIGDVGTVKFYYNEPGHKDGEVTFVRTGTGSSSGIEVSGIINPEGGASTVAYLANSVGTDLGTIDLTSAKMREDVEKKVTEADKVYYASVQKDCTQIVFVAKIDDKVFISEPFQKYNYTTQKYVVHEWVAGSMQVTDPASCTKAGEGYIPYTCSVCGQTKTESLTIKPTGHLYAFVSYTLGDNAKWNPSDTADDKGKVESLKPVADDMSKDTFTYYKNLKCSSCQSTTVETITEKVTIGSVEVINAKNIYQPDTQLKGDLIDVDKMQNPTTELLNSIRLEDCNKVGSYDIVVKDNSTGKELIKVSVAVPAHHSAKDKFVAKDKDGKVVDLSSDLFVIVEEEDANGTKTKVPYSKICKTLDYYTACEWCGELRNADPTAAPETAQVKDEYKNNHNFNINGEELNACTDYDALVKLCKNTGVTVGDLTVDGNCEKGATVELTYKCTVCGASVTDKAIIEDLFHLPLEKDVTISHNWKYEDIKVETPATCTTAGKRTAKAICQNKGCEYNSTEGKPVEFSIPATGHDFDTENLIVKIDGDKLLDSVKDRKYKVGGTYGPEIGYLEDYKVAVTAGYACKNGCGTMDEAAASVTLKVTGLKLGSRIDSVTGGTITLEANVVDANAKELAYTFKYALKNADGTVTLKDLTTGDPSDDKPVKDANNKKRFTVQFGVTSIDQAPEITTVAPVVPTTEPPVVSTTEAPVVATTVVPVVPTTEAPVVPTTEAPVVPTTEAPVVPTTVAPVVEPTTEVTTVEPATMPAQVTGEKVTKNSPTTGTIGVKYNAVEGADSYTVNVREPNGTWKKNPTNGAETAYDITGLTEGKCYDIRIAAVASGIAGPRSGHLYRWLKKVTLMKPTKIKDEAGAVNVTWDAADGASLYKLYVSSDKAFKKDVQKIKAAENTAKVTGLKAGTKYYFKVRCYTKAADGVTYTGGWSNVKSKTLK